MFGIVTHGFKIGGPFLLVLSLLFAGDFAAAAESAKVRIGVTRYIGDAHNYIAQQKGLFKKHGLDAELVLNKTGIENVQKLLRGEVDFAMILPTPIVINSFKPNSFLRGAEPDPEYAVIANLMQSDSLNSVTAATDRGIKTPKDLEGKKLALLVGTGSEYYWYSYADYHDIDHDNVRIVDAKIKDIRGLIETGAADAYTLWEPVSTTVRKQISVPTLELPAQRLYASGRFVIVRRDFAEKRTDLVERYLEALLEAESILQQDFEETTRIMSRQINISEEDVRLMQEKITFNLALDESVLFNVTEQAKWLIRTRYNGEKSIPDYRTILFEGPLAKIKPGGVNFLK